MATPLSSSQILQIFRQSGVSYRTRPGWGTHNRGNRGDGWGITDRNKTGVHGVMIHHTGPYTTESAILEYLWTGSVSLPGPLCHAGVAHDGRFHMMSAQRANHAGTGDPTILRHVVAEDWTDPLPAPRFTDGQDGGVDGNARFYGFELINRGDGKEEWPALQVNAAARAAAAICRKHGWSERSVIGHLEWQRGKVDPRGFSMAAFRKRVRIELAALERAAAA
jgi:hypothetical protein